MEYAIYNLDKYYNSDLDKLKMLKGNIRDMALQQIHLPALYNMPLFHNSFSTDFLRKISRIVKFKFVKPMENLFDVFFGVIL